MEKIKLDFIGLGTQKAGTTTLHHILLQHPSIYLPEQKETHFFNRKETYSRGLDWYGAEHFPGTSNKGLTLGEFTPDYLYMPGVAERIHGAFGDSVKFIVSLRNPVDRAVSHYNMIYRRGLEFLSFEEAIRQEGERLAQGEEENLISHAYLDKGLYSTQINRYFELFDKENFLFLLFEEDIKRNIESTVRKIEGFLGVPHFGGFNYDIHVNRAYTPKSIWVSRFFSNKNKAKTIAKSLLPYSFLKKVKAQAREMNKGEKKGIYTPDSAMLEYLYGYFKEDVPVVSELIGRDLSCWKKTGDE